MGDGYDQKRLIEENFRADSDALIELKNPVGFRKKGWGKPEEKSSLYIKIHSMGEEGMSVFPYFGKRTGLLWLRKIYVTGFGEDIQYKNIRKITHASLPKE